jgi:Ca2+-binding RTX toxin-like protein
MGSWSPRNNASSGNDVFTGDNSDETVDGEGGNDVLYGNGGGDFLTGGAGSDTLYGGAGSNNLYAFSSFDALNDTDIDYLYAGPEWNILHGGKGDHFIGNVSGDSIVYYYLRPNETFLDLRTINAAGTGVTANGTHFTLIDFIFVNSGSLNAVTLYGHEGPDQLIGGQGGDRIFGFGGTDSLSGFLGNDTLDGGAGNDSLDGLDGADQLIGGQGDDSLDGGDGVDTMDGGAGNDTYRVSSLSDVIIEGADSGTDTVRASSTSFRLAANLENLEYVAPSHPILPGTDPRNFLGIGNALNNSISGGEKNDTLYGGDGDDGLSGGDDFDALYGGTGGDLLNGGAGADFMAGGDGGDSYVVDSASDIVSEAPNQGVDTVISLLASYTLSANVEDMQFAPWGGDGALKNFTGIGNALDNTITGGEKNDWLDGRGGADSLNGLDGDDVYVVDNVGDIIGESLGNDTIRTSLSSYVLPALIENIVFTGAGAFSATGTLSNNRFTGGGVSDSIDGAGGVDLFQASYASTSQPVIANTSAVTVGGVTVAALTSIERLDITSGSGADSLTGGAYGDRFDAGAGADTLDGGGGPDTLIGGAGNDTYIVANSGDVTTETSPAGGVDKVLSWLSWTLGVNFENLTLMGSAALNGTGNALNNWLVGNGAANTLNGLAGHDVLNGGAGADRMYGGLGNDIYYVDSPADLVSERANEGTDTVRTTVSYVAPANVERIILEGAGWINATGNTLANSLTGNEGNNILNGGLGADTMAAGDGNDTYFVDNAGDVITESSPNHGIDRVFTAISLVLGTNLEQLVLQGTSSINGTGNTLSNTITGNSAENILSGGGGDDTLNGGAGADRMIGGTGNDRYYVDSARDVVVESPGQGTDAVYSSISYQLGANLENLVLQGSAALFGVGNALNNSLTGNAGANTLNAGAGNDTLIGGAGADILLGGLGADTFVIESAAQLAAGEQINGGAEAATLDTLRLDAAGAYDLSSFTTITNIDQILFAQVAAGFVLTLADSQVDTANALQNSNAHRMQIGSVLQMTHGVTIDASALTGTNAITVIGDRLAGDDTIVGGDWVDLIDGGAGADSMAAAQATTSITSMTRAT